MADPTLYLYTSLTAGSSHIITATSRLETILKANKIPFRALDCATDEKARMTWSRRSRGRKLPGLVKYGQVIGVCEGLFEIGIMLMYLQDLEQIEEWNEFGELHDQIDSADDFVDTSTAAAAPVNPNAISLRPEPGAGVANSFTPIQPASGSARDRTASSNASSRTASETRHISISEPTAQDREGKSPQPSPAENPMMMSMRQLGAEAAAKAKQAQRKVSSSLSKTSSTTAASTSTESKEPVTSPPVIAKEREAVDPSKEPEVTAAKTPAQLASEGAKRTSVDKVEAASTPPPVASPIDAKADAGEDSAVAGSTVGEKSNEEQVLDLRRQSTTTNVPSKLSVSTPADDNEKVPEVQASNATQSTQGISKNADIAEDVEPPVAEAVATDNNNVVEDTPAKTAATSTTNAPDDQPGGHQLRSQESAAALASFDSADGLTPAGSKPRSHRGSSVEEADRAEIQKIEAENRIDEHPEEDEDAVADDDDDAVAATAATKKPVVAQVDADAEKARSTAAKDPEAASKSVGD